jgi:small subunit ribosomal protein S9
LNQHYFAGTGRRKSAVARVRLYPGGGSMIINGKPMEEVFNRPAHLSLILKPLQVSAQSDKFNAQIKVEGGGISAWAGAVAHGIARALLVMDENLRKPLRDHGLLTRDARVKERKKYGLKRARKAPQYTKR